MRDLTQLFSALTSEDRLNILALLLDREELCLCDLAKSLELPKQKLERQLAVLSEAGLVRTWRDGEWLLCAMQPAEQMGAEARIAVSMLRCMLPGERSTHLEDRLQIWLLEKRRTGMRCGSSPRCGRAEAGPKARARRPQRSGRRSGGARAS